MAKYDLQDVPAQKYDLQDTSQGSADKPLETDLFGGDFNRTKSSFGDKAGVENLVKQRGFSDVKTNENGDLVAKGPDGNWYKDQSNFTSHPINWLEKKAGEALPLAGMATGAGIGLGLASIPGAGIGAGAGEGLRALIGKALGTYEGGAGDIVKGAGEEALGGAAAETGGKIIGKGLGMVGDVIPIPGTGMNATEATKAALEKFLYNPARSLYSKGASTISGVDSDAIKAMLERPKEVLSAGRKGNALNVAKQAQAEIAKNDSTEGGLISAARKAYVEKYGQEPVSTNAALQTLIEAEQRHAPNAYGQSALSPDDFEAIKSLKQTLGANNAVPAETAASLQKTVDALNASKPGNYFDQTGKQKFKSDAMTGIEANAASKTKRAMQALSPDLAAADLRFHNYAENGKLLGGLENPATMESATANMFGKNRGAIQEAAASNIPETYQQMADIGALKAFGGDPLLQGKFSMGPTSPALLRVGLPAASYLINPALGAGVTAASIATSPTVAKYGSYLAGQALRTNQLAPWALLDQINKQRSTDKNPWSLTTDKENPK